MSRHLANRLGNSLDDLQSGDDEALGNAPYVRATSNDALSALSTNVDYHEIVGETDPHLGISAGLGESATTYADKPVGTVPQLADYLINGYWQFAGYSAHQWGSNTITYNLGNLTASERTLAQDALNLWHEVANINFVLTTGTANITFNHNGSMVASTSASWNGSTHFMTSATIQISSNWITSDGGANDGRTGIYSYGFQTYVHEIGHALGLGHQGAYNGSATYGTDNVYANDTWQYSIMSYFPQNRYDGGTYNYTITPMMADITAIQLMYGAATTRTGNTVYGFNSNAGSVYDFSLYLAYGAPAFTIYDSGGADTLNCSGYSANQTIDLTPGAFCSIGGYTHNIGIFTTTMIESAVGGTGNDSIYGNSANNTLIGGAGNDVFDGNGGADILTGNAGADKFIFDAAAYADATATVASIDRISDYNRGNNGSFSSAEGDQIDLTALLATAYGSGQAVNALVRVVENGDGTGAFLQVDVDGTANGAHWVTLAQLDSMQLGQTVSVVLNSSQPNGITLTTQVDPNADLTASVYGAPTSVAAGSNLTFAGDTFNLGQGTAAVSITRFYLSTDATITTADRLIGFDEIPTLTAYNNGTGWYDHYSMSLLVPGDLAPGTYYLGAISDYNNQVLETNENNNVWNTVQISVTPAGGSPDLTASVFVAATSVAAGANLTLAGDTFNLGQGTAAASTTRFYLSTDATITTADRLIGFDDAPMLTAYNNGTGWYDHYSMSLLVPGDLAPGTYYLGAISDYNNQVLETNENNNFWNTVQISVTPAVGSPDLTASVFVAATSVAAGANLAFAGDTFNLGQGTAAASTTRFYLSTDATITTADRLIGFDDAPTLTAYNNGTGWYDHYSMSLLVPGDLAPGTYYLGAISDYNSQIFETNENNNIWNTVQISVTPAGGSPDLTASVFVAATSVAAGANLTFNGDTFNLGQGTAAASTTRFYLSTDATITTADRLIGFDDAPTLTAYNNGTGWYDHYSMSLLVPGDLAPGTYYLGAISDYNNQILETNENNNIWNTVQISVTPAGGSPDLTASVFVAATSVAAGANLTFAGDTFNLGQGTAAASTTRFYLSTDATITTADRLIGFDDAPTLTAYNNGTGWYDHYSMSLLVPGDLAPGTYYLGAISDYNNQVLETNENNNVWNTVQISVTPTVGSPDLTASVFVAAASVSAGANLDFAGDTFILGQGTAAASTMHFYLSTDANITTVDTDANITTVDLLIGFDDAPPLTAYNNGTGWQDHYSMSRLVPGELAANWNYSDSSSHYNNQDSEINENNSILNFDLTNAPGMIVNHVSDLWPLV